MIKTIAAIDLGTNTLNTIVANQTLNEIEIIEEREITPPKTEEQIQREAEFLIKFNEKYEKDIKEDEKYFNPFDKGYENLMEISNNQIMP